MNIYRDIHNLPKFKNAVMTIGSFDGVHLGHKRLTDKIKSIAKKIDGEDVVVTFDPHPRSIIFPNDTSLKLLTSLEEKLRLMEIAGVSNVVVVPFNIEFSQQSPREYIEKFIIEAFAPAYLVIGYDHRYGLNRKGDYNLLKEYESKGSFSLVKIEKEELDDIAISSTKIRSYLGMGDITNANSFLGYNYSISGQVVHGEKIGATLGFPTANINLVLAQKVVPKPGIYTVKVTYEDVEYGGMLYIGNRPSISTNGNVSIEVNIFDFNTTIYGEILKIEFINFIREDIKFENLIQLKNQLHFDKKKAKRQLGEDTLKVKAPKIAIAILNYNGRAVLERYLPSLKNSSNLYKYDTYVIDNASTDDSVEYLNSYHPEVKTILLDKNYGYAGGYNAGLAFLTHDYLALVNSDIKATEGWIDPLVTLLENDHSIGCVQPKILSDANPSLFEYAGAAGGYIDALGYPFCRGRIFDSIEKDTAQYDDNTEIAWVSGAAFIIRKDIFEAFNGFDASYFAHQEEIDLCLRIRKAGYKCIASGQSKVYHLGGGTLSYENPNKTYLNFRNNLSTILKNFTFFNLLYVLPFRLVLDGVAGVKFILDGKWKNTIAIIKAHFSFYAKVPSILIQRKLTNKIVTSSKIGPSRIVGNYPQSILWAYYVKGKKYFSEL